MERRLAGTLLARFENKGFSIAAAKIMVVDEKLARKHYRALTKKSFFPRILNYITRGPIMALVLEGPNAIEAIRLMLGPTESQKAPAGTIRGDFSLSTTENLVHASDSAQSAKREIALFFEPSEFIDAK